MITTNNGQGPSVASPTEGLDALRATAVSLATSLPERPARLTVTSGADSIAIEWTVTPAAEPPPAAAAVAAEAPAPAPGPAAEAAETAAPAGPVAAVVAPLVGTFYGAPAPGEAPFVSVGDTVRPGQQVAIVEAMKLMNAVAADRGGVVTAVRVSDGEMVEFGQVLVEIDPTAGEG